MKQLWWCPSDIDTKCSIRTIGKSLLLALGKVESPISYWEDRFLTKALTFCIWSCLLLSGRQKRILQQAYFPRTSNMPPSREKVDASEQKHNARK